MNNNNSYSRYRNENKKKKDPKKPTQAVKTKGNKKTKPKKVERKQSDFQNTKKRKEDTRRIKEGTRRTKEERHAIAEQKRLDKEARAASRREGMKDVKRFLLELLKKLAIALIAILLIGETLLMINQYAIMDELKFQISDINKELEKDKNYLKELNSEKEAAYKSENIENIAKYNLGMVYPSKEQTIYINLD